jgi:replicative DNA helicase
MELYDRNAEEAVLGSVLIDPESYYHLSAFLKAPDFYILRNQMIWQAMGVLSDAKIDIDFLTITSELDKRGEDWGGSSYLSSLLSQVPTSLNAISYGRIVEAFSKRRGLEAMANKVVNLAHAQKPIEEIMVLAQSEASKAVERGGSNRVSSKEAASQAIDSIIGHPRYFTFGVSNLDDKLSGIFPDRLYIWAGYQGTGKSAFKIQNSRKNAEAGYKVMDVSLEMSPAQTWLRMACGDLGIDLDSILANKVDEDTKSDVMNRAGELGDMYEKNIVIYPAPMTLVDILAAAKTERPDIIWIDHSNLISGKPKEMNLLEWAGYIPRFLRQNISKLGISVHLLQQLNRGANKENRRPTMHDIRLAGEDDPDMVTLLYRPDSPDLPMGMAEIEFICDKNRFGWTGTEKIMFDLPHQDFKSTSTIVFNPIRQYAER